MSNINILEEIVVVVKFVSEVCSVVSSLASGKAPDPKPIADGILALAAHFKLSLKSATEADLENAVTSIVNLFI